MTEYQQGNTSEDAESNLGASYDLQEMSAGFARLQRLQWRQESRPFRDGVDVLQMQEFGASML
ncbi:hypothetical protein [Arthrobacter sp. HS15c]|uniref:hypothetical protein n=1 Tax=Arthrobacter sp. HS15c TaxID=3230279 RepID=UPI0034654FE4